MRDYIFIDDLIEGIYRAATYNTTSRVFNLGSGKGYSLNSIIEIIRDTVGNNLTVNYLEKRTFDLPEIYLDINKAQQELLWTPVTSLKEGIKVTWEFVKNILHI